jgi:hypothetical protein
MHFEFDVIEVIAVLIAWFTVKWTFRILLVALIGKAISQAKNKAMEGIGNVKQQFESFEESQRDHKRDQGDQPDTK